MEPKHPGGRPKGRFYTEIIHIKVDPDQKARIKALADALSTSVGQLVRDWIEAAWIDFNRP